jgi:hypothetical protein
VARIDADCDTTATIADVMLVVQHTLGNPLVEGLDANANGCVDTCELDSDSDGTPNWRDCAPVHAGVGEQAEEVCNGIDDDCNGVVDDPEAASVVQSCADGLCTVGGACGVSPAPGQKLLITEVWRSEAAGGDWVELYNPGPNAVNVYGWKLESVGAAEFLLTQPEGFAISAGQYTLVAAPGANPPAAGLLPLLRVPGFELATGSGPLVLRDPSGSPVITVPIDHPEMAAQEGHSVALRAPWLDASLPASWMASTASASAVLFATPGGPNLDVVLDLCEGGSPRTCDDGLSCTVDSCNPASGCEYVVEGLPGVGPGAAEIPGDGIDQNCDGMELCFVDADGDAARTSSTVLSEHLACDGPGLANAGRPLDCNDTASDIHPEAVELAVDGVDSNCDGLELFDGHLLSYAGTMGPGPFSVALSGTFTFPYVGAVPVTGAASREAPGAPVVYCITSAGLAFNFVGVNGFSLNNATVELCAQGAASVPDVSLSGIASAGPLSLAATGTLLRAAPHDVELWPTGTVMFREQAWEVTQSQTLSGFWVLAGEPMWAVSVHRSAWALSEHLELSPAMIQFASDGAVLNAKTSVGAGPQGLALTVWGSVPSTGDFTLAAKADTPYFQPFTLTEWPMAPKATGTTGELSVSGAGATVTLESTILCNGNCCEARADGGCEIPSMESCVVAKRPACATVWSGECVAELGSCDLTVADFLRIKSPKITVTTGDGSWKPTLTGLASVTGISGFDVPAAPLVSRLGTCRDPDIRACACEHDQACCAAGGQQCPAVVQQHCGGAPAVAKCGHHQVYFHAEMLAPWSPSASSASFFRLRNSEWDMWAEPLVQGPDALPLSHMRPEKYGMHGKAVTTALMCVSGQCPEWWWNQSGTPGTLQDEGARPIEMRGYFDPDVKYFVGELAQARLPVFEDTAGVAVVFSLTPLPLQGSGFFDIMGTPDEPNDDVQLLDGLSLVAFAPAAIPIPEELFDGLYPQPMWSVAINVSLGGATLEAWAKFNWTVIPPGFVPTVESLRFQSIRGYASIGTASLGKLLLTAAGNVVKNAFKKDTSKLETGVVFGVEAAATLQPTNQTQPLVGKVNLEFQPDKAGGIAGGNLFLAGKWVEPFGLADFAVQTLGTTIYLNVETGFPVALGTTRNYFWRPPGCEWPSLDADWLFEPGCLATYQMGFLVMPWTDLMMNFELSNVGLNTASGVLMSMANTAINHANFWLDEVENPTLTWTKVISELGWDVAKLLSLEPPTSLPNLSVPFSIPEIPGFDFVLNKAKFYLAPKALFRWGQYFRPGVIFDGELTINDTWKGKYRSELKQLGFIPKGVQLIARVDPIAIGPLQLQGDPYDRVLHLQGGHVQVAHNDLLTPPPVTDATGTHPQFTVEAKVSKQSFAPMESVTLYEKWDDQNGVSVRLERLGKSPVVAKETLYPELPEEGGTFGGEGEDPGMNLAWVVLDVRNGGQLRRFKSERGVLPPSAELVHVSVSLRGEQAIAVVDGAAVPLFAEGAAIVPGHTTAAAVIGKGLDKLDEFRFWRRFRAQELASWEKDTLGVLSGQHPDLVLRYTMDWDSGGQVYNSRNVASSHATVVGAHTLAPAPATEINVRMDADWLQLPPKALMQLEAGASIPLPSANEPTTFRLWARQDSTTLSQSGEFYAEGRTLFTTPWGALRLDGNGPNGQEGDFDDGVFGGLEAAPGRVELNSSSRLEWVEPSGNRKKIAESTTFLGCPVGTTCNGLGEHVFESSGSIDLQMQASGLPAVRIQGDALVSSVTKKLEAEGSIQVGDLQLTASSLVMDSQKIAFSTQLDLPEVFGIDFGAVNTQLTLTYLPFSLCGTTNVVNTTLNVNCDVSVCVKFLPSATVTLEGVGCQGRCWNDSMCGANQFCDLLGQCWDKKSNGDVCPGLIVGDRECQSGYCDSWSQFPVSVCAEKLQDWYFCLENDQCASNHCGIEPGTVVKRCYTPSVLPNGERCPDALSCIAGQCWGSLVFPATCYCNSNADCAPPYAPSGTICRQGNWGLDPNAGLCQAPSEAGGPCSNTAECAPGLWCGGGQCYLPYSVPNWGACVAHENCQAGLCYFGTCRCYEHFHCGNAYCDKGDWLTTNAEGKCGSQKQPDGAYCEDGEWCQSGNCSGKKCYTKNSKSNWQECVANDECRGGSCYSGRCRCSEHGQCHGDPAFGGNSYCDTGIWLPTNEEGRCHTKRGNSDFCEDPVWCASGNCHANKCWAPASKSNWESCVVTEECRQGQCWDFRCRCASHEQCSADPAFGWNTYCDLGPWLATNQEGKCGLSKRNDGEYCEDGNWCWSGNCMKNTCYTPLSRSNWDWCLVDGECRGSCWDWRCRCTEHSNCTSDPNFGADSYCDMGPWLVGNEEGRCRVGKRGNGEYCEDGQWCQSGNCAHNKCWAPQSRSNWESCVVNAECRQGQCWNGQCRCENHSQCSDDPAFGWNTYCDMGPWLTTNQEGKCGASKRADGEYCEDGNWCWSGNCMNNTCFTPLSRSNWDWCWVDGECRGSCWNWRCRCIEHHHCTSDPNFGADSYCDKGDWLAINEEGRCRLGKKNDGEYCEDGAWCKSGHCASGQCFTPNSRSNWETCVNDAHCKGGSCWNGRCRCTEHSNCTNDPTFGWDSYCDMGSWTTLNEEGRCRVGKSGEWGYCEDGNWCHSGNCANFQCFTPHTRSNWDTCITDAHCRGGSCWNGRCRCTEHDQCSNDPNWGGNAFCDKGSWLPTNEEGKCRTDKRVENDHQYCEDGAWCWSGMCGWSPKWLQNNCFTYAGFGAGHWCDMNEHCASFSCTWKIFAGWTCN